MYWAFLSHRVISSNQIINCTVSGKEKFGRIFKNPNNLNLKTIKLAIKRILKDSNMSH